MNSHENTSNEIIKPIQNVTNDDEKFIKAVKRLNLKDPALKEPLTPEDLIEFLKDDVVCAFERPGSWEGSNMLKILHSSHGFIGY